MALYKFDYYYWTVALICICLFVVTVVVTVYLVGCLLWRNKLDIIVIQVSHALVGVPAFTIPEK